MLLRRAYKELMTLIARRKDIERDPLAPHRSSARNTDDGVFTTRNIRKDIMESFLDDMETPSEKQNHELAFKGVSKRIPTSYECWTTWLSMVPSR